MHEILKELEVHDTNLKVIKKRYNKTKKYLKEIKDNRNKIKQKIKEEEDKIYCRIFNMASLSTTGFWKHEDFELFLNNILENKTVTKKNKKRIQRITKEVEKSLCKHRKRYESYKKEKEEESDVLTESEIRDLKLALLAPGANKKIR